MGIRTIMALKKHMCLDEQKLVNNSSIASPEPTVSVFKIFMYYKNISVETLIN